MHSSETSMKVRLDGCNGLIEFTWLLFAPMLTILRVVQWRDIEEIIILNLRSSLSFICLSFSFSQKVMCCFQAKVLCDSVCLN